MLVKGTFISQPSGSLGGITASHNRSGTYLRARVIPVDPNTVFQQEVRTLQGNLSSAWVETLTPAQRAAWDLYGASVAVTNRVGDAIFLTGLNWFIAMNVSRLQLGLNQINDGPTIFSLTEVTLPSMAISESTQQVTINYTNSDAWASEDLGYLRFSLSRPKNPTINYFKGPYRFTNFVAGAVLPPTSPELADIPFPVVEGQRVFALLRGGLADGRISTDIRIFADVAA